MNRRHVFSPLRMLSCALATVLAPACAGVSPHTVAETRDPGAFDPEQHLWVREAGAKTKITEYAAELADIDLIAFGELHGHSVGSRYEFELLKLLASQDRPLALALEFFEADQQRSLDLYLAGELDEATFLEATKRSKAYADTHRPLIEFCKAQGIAVIAANAPRALVTAYRKSGLEYPDYLQSLSETERAWMPKHSVPPQDEHRDRFMRAMAGMEHGESFFKSMALWNDAMAESIANFRSAHPDHRVFYIVGSFHVDKHLGTITQYTQRRPDDRVRVLTMKQVDTPELAFGDEHRGEADALLLVREQPQ